MSLRQKYLNTLIHSMPCINTSHQMYQDRNTVRVRADSLSIPWYIEWT
jgi:hypothetical protein